ncbi:12122_t:CDS:2, partial [Entrophospora sp. SA101]
ADDSNEHNGNIAGASNKNNGIVTVLSIKNNENSSIDDKNDIKDILNDDNDLVRAFNDDYLVCTSNGDNGHLTSEVVRSILGVISLRRTDSSLYKIIAVRKSLTISFNNLLL